MKKDWIIFETLPEYFEFFEAIPEEKWCVGEFQTEGKMCAIGHLTNGKGDISPDFLSWNLHQDKLHPFRLSMKEIREDASDINNGHLFGFRIETADLGDTPKERILNAIILKESGILDEVE